MSAQAFPQFVWRVHPSREGVVIPEVWYHECTTGRFVKGGKLESQPTAARHTLTRFMQNASLRELAEVYPPPAGWRREQ